MGYIMYGMQKERKAISKKDINGNKFNEIVRRTPNGFRPLDGLSDIFLGGTVLCAVYRNQSDIMIKIGVMPLHGKHVSSVCKHIH